MNKHIELVKKWLADPDSVTEEELKQNRADVADATYWKAADAAYRADADAAAYAAYWAAASSAAYAAYWVERYEALENDNE